jgi:hypothetical protein
VRAGGLKDALRRREIHVAGATRWRNPEEDLPTDFEDNRDVHYGNLRQPLDAGVFIAAMKEGMRTSMTEAATAISKKRSGGTKVKTHRGEPRLARPRHRQAGGPGEPAGPARRGSAQVGHHRSDGLPQGVRLHHKVHRRLLHRRHPENALREVIHKRLLLMLYALGTNIGIKRVADGGKDGETEAALRAARYLFVNRDNLRKAIATLVNATLKMRDPL